MEARVLSLDHQHLADAVKEAVRSDVDVVVLGGGDGTLATGAAGIVGTSKTMGILPLGTLNHFAKDLGIPLTLDDAAKVIAADHRIAIDVGDVNGRLFLNNSSIGLYPSAVDERDELRHRNGGGKFVAMFQAAVDVLRRFPLLDVIVTSDGSAADLRVPFVFVGNNRYEMSLFSLGKRHTLQGGELGLYFTQTTGRLGILRLGLPRPHRPDAARPGLPLHHAQDRRNPDSEAVGPRVDGWRGGHLTSPIRYAIRAGALRVLAPERDTATLSS